MLSCLLLVDKVVDQMLPHSQQSFDIVESFLMKRDIPASYEYLLRQFINLVSLSVLRIYHKNSFACFSYYKIQLFVL